MCFRCLEKSCKTSQMMVKTRVQIKESPNKQIQDSHWPWEKHTKTPRRKAQRSTNSKLCPTIDEPCWNITKNLFFLIFFKVNLYSLRLLEKVPDVVTSFLVLRMHFSWYTPGTNQIATDNRPFLPQKGNFIEPTYLANFQKSNFRS